MEKTKVPTHSSKMVPSEDTSDEDVGGPELEGEAELAHALAAVGAASGRQA